MLLKVGTFCKDSDVQVLLGGSVVVALDSFESIFCDEGIFCMEDI